MFKTQQEAKAAAPGFACKGAHQMGSMWMVCAKHEEAEAHGHHRSPWADEWGTFASAPRQNLQEGHAGLTAELSGPCKSDEDMGKC